MSKRVYSARRLVAKEFDEIVARLGSASVVLGIDVAKREQMLMLRAADEKFFGPYRANNPDQVADIVELVRRISARGQVKVAMESSGTYGDALRQALSEAGIELQRVEAKWSRDYAEVFDGVPSQHDGKDAAVIAELCAIGKSSVWAYRLPDETESRMRLLVEWIDGKDRTRRLWIGRIEALLARHWPEATRVMDLSSGTLMRALVHYGGPGGLAADTKALENLVGWGGNLLRRGKAVELLESAKTSLGVKQNAVDRERLSRCAGEVLGASLEVKRSKQRLKELAQGNPVIQAQAAAIGVVSACVLWCRIGDPRNYPAAEAYRKAMGLNLTERSSGQYKGEARISKRGDRLVRRWLHMAALRLINKHPEVKEWYRQKRGRDGNRHLCALTAVVRRLVIALHKVATKDDPFDAQRLFAGITAAQAAGGK